MYTFRLSALALIICCIFAVPAWAQPATTVLHIDPAQALGGTAAELFDSVGYIPLETSPESLFGKIEQLFITDEYFIILDYDTNCILLFFKNGKFHCKIKGNAIAKTSRYLGIPFFAVDTRSREISFALDSVTNAVFDFNGRKIREDRAINSTCFYSFPGHKQVYMDIGVKRHSHSDPTTGELRWLDRSGIYRQALPFLSQITGFTPKDYLEPAGTTFSTAPADSVAYYTRCYDYTVYQLGQDSFSPTYSIVLPASISLPMDFRTNPVYKDHRFEYVVRQHPDLVYTIAHFYQLGQLLFFQLENSHHPDNSSFIYSLSSGALWGIDHIAPDSTNCFLPIFHNQGTLTFSFSANNFLCTGGGFIYTSASSTDMLSIPKGKDNPLLTKNPRLHDYYQRLVRTDNPVIIQLKPKQTL